MLDEIDWESGAWSASVRRASPNGFATISIVPSGITANCLFWLGCRSLLVNRFAVLNVEEVNTDIYEPIDIPLPSTLDRKALPRRPKWEKRLSRQLSTNTLNTRGTSIIFPIEISATDTSKMHSVKAFLDSRATGNFIDKDFVHTKGISI